MILINKFQAQPIGIPYAGFISKVKTCFFVFQAQPIGIPYAGGRKVAKEVVKFQAQPIGIPYAGVSSVITNTTIVSSPTDWDSLCRFYNEEDLMKCSLFQAQPIGIPYAGLLCGEYPGG